VNRTVGDAREQILSAEGHVLVLGGAGSGKTTVALHAAAHRIAAGLMPGQCVLFLSFSRARTTGVRRYGRAGMKILKFRDTMSQSRRPGRCVTQVGDARQSRPTPSIDPPRALP